jgi:hypothetical protein
MASHSHTKLKIEAIARSPSSTAIVIILGRLVVREKGIGWLEVGCGEE